MNVTSLSGELGTRRWAAIEARVHGAQNVVIDVYCAPRKTHMPFRLCSTFSCSEL